MFSAISNLVNSQLQLVCDTCMVYMCRYDYHKLNKVNYPFFAFLFFVPSEEGVFSLSFFFFRCSASRFLSFSALASAVLMVFLARSGSMSLILP